VRLEAFADAIAVVALVDLERMRHLQPRQRLAELRVRRREGIAVADVDRDRAQ